MEWTKILLIQFLILLFFSGNDLNSPQHDRKEGRIEYSQQVHEAVHFSGPLPEARTAAASMISSPVREKEGHEEGHGLNHFFSVFEYEYEEDKLIPFKSIQFSVDYLASIFSSQNESHKRELPFYFRHSFEPSHLFLYLQVFRL